MTKFRPMLASPYEVHRVEAILAQVGFMYMQPKIDGMRVLVDDNLIPRSRSGKEHKNIYLRQWCSENPSLRGLDGEVFSGHVMAEDVFRQSMSGIRSQVGSKEFTFYAFDNFLEAKDSPYAERLGWVKDTVFHHGPAKKSDNYDYDVRLLTCPTTKVTSIEQIDRLYQLHLHQGWEGSILRHPFKPYKYNRATPVGGELLKIKPFDDAEAEITGYYAWEENHNEATASPLGLTARSSHKENKVAIARLGGVHCRLLDDPTVTFDIGVFRGLTHGDRDRLWLERDGLVGRIIKFSHQGIGGGYDKPRTPVGLAFRDPVDIG